MNSHYCAGKINFCCSRSRCISNRAPKAPKRDMKASLNSVMPLQSLLYRWCSRHSVMLSLGVAASTNVSNQSYQMFRISSNVLTFTCDVVVPPYCLCNRGWQSIRRCWFHWYALDKITYRRKSRISERLRF